MNVVVARVARVLSGHSTAAMVHAVDEHGHEQRLELPAAAVAELTPGAVLVLQWSVHRLPDTLAEAPPTANASPSAAATRPPPPSTNSPLGNTERSAADNTTSDVRATNVGTLDLPEPLASLLGIRASRTGRT